MSDLKNFPPFTKIHGNLPTPKRLGSVTSKDWLLPDDREQGNVCVCLLWQAGDLG